LDRKLLAVLRSLLGPVPIALVLEDTENLPDIDSPIVGTVRIADRSTLISMALNPEVAFGDAYSSGKIDMEGDLVSSLEYVCRSSPRVRNWSWHLLSKWFDWAQSNTKRGSSRNIQHHYDLSNDFYRLWLDGQMVYTCAYFPTPDASLGEAQEAKLDLVCRKLCLRPGESVVEVGCGWGALAIYMAQHYGVRVKAFNISHEQIVWARESAKEAGVASRVEFVEDDYRNVSGRFDVFVSVGMLEHVGRENYPELGRVIHRAIGDTGRGFLHFIGRNRPQPFSVWTRKRIFPGAYCPSLRESMQVLEPQNYCVLDIENLRQHYAKTLEHWLARFESEFDTVVQMHGVEFARMWRLYLAGSIASFRAGNLQLFQVLFAGSRCQSIPWTREHLYAPVREETDNEQWTRAM
jgi:cyclopropane-fatty-acyl-phospholipid synthase